MNYHESNQKGFKPVNDRDVYTTDRRRLPMVVMANHLEQMIAAAIP